MATDKDIERIETSLKSLHTKLDKHLRYDAAHVAEMKGEVNLLHDLKREVWGNGDPKPGLKTKVESLTGRAKRSDERMRWVVYPSIGTLLVSVLLLALKVLLSVNL